MKTTMKRWALLAAPLMLAQYYPSYPPPPLQAPPPVQSYGEAHGPSFQPFGLPPAPPPVVTQVPQWHGYQAPPPPSYGDLFGSDPRVTGGDSN